MSIRTFATAVALLACLPLAAAESPVLVQALEDELERNMNGLELEDVDVRPHFIAYTVHSDHNISVTAAQGGLQNMNTSRTRRLQIEMRVGTPEFDNSNYISQRLRNRSVNVTLSLADDYDLLRKQIWLATDRAYRSAVEVYASKEAALQNSEQEHVIDFSTEEPNVYIDSRKSPKLDLKEPPRFAQELSDVGSNQSFIYERNVTVFANQHQDTYINSEGSHFTRVDDTAFIRATATTQAKDGRYLSDYVNVVGRGWDDVADLPNLKKQVKAMHERLMELYEAEPLDRYNGPILFAGQGAAEMIGQTLARNLVNYKRPVFETDMMAGMFNRMFPLSSLKERLGARVLPRSWSVYDDATQQTFQDIKLVGHYPVDSDGLETRRVDLIERGVLKTLLTDRNPTKEIQQSTASNATSAGPSISNLFVEANDGLEDEELRQLLLDIVAENGGEFGIRIDRVRNPFIQVSGVPNPMLGNQLGQGLSAIRAYKVFPDGHEEVVRDVYVSTDLIPELKNLPGYSASRSVHNMSYLFLGGDVSTFASSAPTYVSIVTPDILIEDATIAYPQGIVRSLPLMARPGKE